MTYSCTDFVDSILDALDIEVPEESWDSPSDQASLALAEIERLQRFEKEIKHALEVLAVTCDKSRFVARAVRIAGSNERA